MDIVPYVSFGEIRLRETESDVIRRVGAPERRVVNRARETELDYVNVVARVDPVHGVVEITARPDHVCIGQDIVSRHDLPTYLRTSDSEATNDCGFVVSRRFGVAVDADTVNDGWISVFAEGRWDNLASEA